MLYLTQVVFGRARTVEEAQTLDSYNASHLTQYMDLNSKLIDVADTASGQVSSFTDNFVKAWNDQTAADGYIALVNGFTPAPVTVKTLS